MRAPGRGFPVFKVVGSTFAVLFCGAAAAPAAPAGRPVLGLRRGRPRRAFPRFGGPPVFIPLGWGFAVLSSAFAVFLSVYMNEGVHADAPSGVHVHPFGY